MMIKFTCVGTWRLSCTLPGKISSKEIAQDRCSTRYNKYLFVAEKNLCRSLHSTAAATRETQSVPTVISSWKRSKGSNDQVLPNVPAACVSTLPIGYLVPCQTFFPRNLTTQCPFRMKTIATTGKCQPLRLPVPHCPLRRGPVGR